MYKLTAKVRSVRLWFFISSWFWLFANPAFADLDLPTQGICRLAVEGYPQGFYYDRLSSGTFRIRRLSGNGLKPNRFDRGTTIEGRELYKMLISLGELKPVAGAAQPGLEMATKGVCAKAYAGYPSGFYYDYIDNGMFRVRALSGNGVRPNSFDKGKIFEEKDLFKALVELGVINPSTAFGDPGLKMPNAGRYVTAQGNAYFYDYVGSGMFRVRAASGGNGNRPNSFDKGSVVEEKDLFKTLVETGALKPIETVEESRFGIPNSGRYVTQNGRYAYFYESVGGGMYRVRAASGGNGNRPNSFDKGSVVDEEVLFKKLVETGALKPIETVEASRFGIPNAGRYVIRNGRYAYFYESVGGGMYRVRAASGGNGRRPNSYDKGRVINEKELYTILVETGTMRPCRDYLSEE